MKEETRQFDAYKRLINFAARIILIIVQMFMFSHIWYGFYARDMEGILLFWRRGNWTVIAIYTLILFFFTQNFGGYKIGYQRISDMALSHILAIVCSNIVGYLEVTLIIRMEKGYANPTPILGLTVAEVLVTFAWIYMTRVIFVRMFPPRRLLVIYDQRSPESIISKINARPDKYRITDSINVSEGHEAVYAKVDTYEAVVLCDIRSSIRNDILKYCFENEIRTYITPKLSDIIISGSEGIYLFDTPLYLSRNHGLSMDQRMVKRTFDVVISLLLLVVLSPFYLLTALCIYAYDRGPVFYYQERLTRDGRLFKMIKFRSMTTDSEKSGARLATQKDSRITPVGRFIRRIHFDEMPQMINVLKGDMSFVGPRPERPEIAAVYKEKIPEFDYRLRVKAGLTGYAQVYGKYNTTPYDKLKLDMTYIENYSFFLDIKIILGTMKVIFQKENTEGFDESKAVPDHRVDDVKREPW